MTSGETTRVVRCVDFAFLVDEGMLKLTLMGVACELARGLTDDEPVPVDWYVGYSCTDP